MATVHSVPAEWLDSPMIDEHAAQRFAERVLDTRYQPAWYEAIAGYVQALATVYPLTQRKPQGLRVWRGQLGPLTVIWDERRHVLVTVLPTVRTERHALHLPFDVSEHSWIGDRAEVKTWRALQQGGRLIQVAAEGWTAWQAPLLTEPVWVHFGLRLMQSTPELVGDVWDGGPVDYEHQDDCCRAILRAAARDMAGAWGQDVPGGGWLGRTPRGFVVWVDTKLQWLRAAWRPTAYRWALDTGDDALNWEWLWEQEGRPTNSGTWERILAAWGYTLQDFEDTYWGGWTRLAAHQWPADHPLPAAYWWNQLNTWVWYLGRAISEEEFRAWATPQPHDLYAWAARSWTATLAQLPRRFPAAQHPCRPAARLPQAS